MLKDVVITARPTWQRTLAAQRWRLVSSACSALQRTFAPQQVLVQLKIAAMLLQGVRHIKRLRSRIHH